MGIFSFFKKEKSKTAAKDRLKFVLIQDRAMISPADMDAIRDEVIEVLSKYVSIDRRNISIDISSCEEDKRQVALVANIPLINKK